MFLTLKEGVLRSLLQKAISKAGNIRKLEKETKISKSSLSNHYRECRAVKDSYLKKLEDYSNVKIKQEDIIDILPDNWRQIKGGINRVKKAKKENGFEQQLKLCHKGSSIFMKRLHKKMKKETPEKYYSIQYEKFKKIAGYKHITKKGEKVRNKLEKDIADLLKEMNINYEYEPLIKVGKRFFFPDFLINKKIIIECTFWRGQDKAQKLKQKLIHLDKEYKTYVVIPKGLYKYYKILNNHLILGLDELVPVAQTFLKA